VYYLLALNAAKTFTELLCSAALIRAVERWFKKGTTKPRASDCTIEGDAYLLLSVQGILERIFIPRKTTNRKGILQ
jgi:hypothetical protein